MNDSQLSGEIKESQEANIFQNFDPFYEINQFTNGKNQLQGIDYLQTTVSELGNISRNNHGVLNNGNYRQIGTNNHVQQHCYRENQVIISKNQQQNRLMKECNIQSNENCQINNQNFIQKDNFIHNKIINNNETDLAGMMNNSIQSTQSQKVINEKISDDENEMRLINHLEGIDHLSGEVLQNQDDEQKKFVQCLSQIIYDEGELNNIDNNQDFKQEKVENTNSRNQQLNEDTLSKQQCNNCKQIPINYIALPCTHNFCINCLTQIYRDPLMCKKGNDNFVELMCYICFKPTKLDFQSQLAIENQIEYQLINNIVDENFIIKPIQNQNVDQYNDTINTKQQNPSNNFNTKENQVEGQQLQEIQDIKLGLNQLPLVFDSINQQYFTQRYQMPKEEVIHEEESMETLITNETNKMILNNESPYQSLQKIQFQNRQSKSNVLNNFSHSNIIINNLLQDNLLKKSDEEYIIRIQELNKAEKQSSSDQKMVSPQLDQNIEEVNKESQTQKNKQQNLISVIQVNNNSNYLSIEQNFKELKKQETDTNTYQLIKENNEVFKSFKSREISKVSYRSSRNSNIENGTSMSENGLIQAFESNNINALSTNCNEHPLEDAQLFCFTCECKCICTSCTEDSIKHKGHLVENVITSYQTLQGKLNFTLNDITSRIKLMDSTHWNFSQQKKNITKKSQEIQNLLTQMFNSVHDTLNHKEQELKALLIQNQTNILQIVDQECNKMQEARKTLETVSGQLSIIQNAQPYEVSELPDSTIAFNYFAECKRVLNEIIQKTKVDSEPIKYFENISFTLTQQILEQIKNSISEIRYPKIQRDALSPSRNIYPSNSCLYFSNTPQQKYLSSHPDLNQFNSSNDNPQLKESSQINKIVSNFIGSNIQNDSSLDQFMEYKSNQNNVSHKKLDNNSQNYLEIEDNFKQKNKNQQLNQQTTPSHYKKNSNLQNNYHILNAFSSQISNHTILNTPSSQQSTKQQTTQKSQQKQDLIPSELNFQKYNFHQLQYPNLLFQQVQTEKQNSPIHENYFQKDMYRLQNKNTKEKSKFQITKEKLSPSLQNNAYELSSFNSGDDQCENQLNSTVKNKNNTTQQTSASKIIEKDTTICNNLINYSSENENNSQNSRQPYINVKNSQKDLYSLNKLNTTSLSQNYGEYLKYQSKTNNNKKLEKNQIIFQPSENKVNTQSQLQDEIEKINNSLNELQTKIDLNQIFCKTEQSPLRENEEYLGYSERLQKVNSNRINKTNIPAQSLSLQALNNQQNQQIKTNNIQKLFKNIQNKFDNQSQQNHNSKIHEKYIHQKNDNTVFNYSKKLKEQQLYGQIEEKSKFHQKHKSDYKIMIDSDKNILPSPSNLNFSKYNDKMNNTQFYNQIKQIKNISNNDPSLTPYILQQEDSVIDKLSSFQMDIKNSLTFKKELRNKELDWLKLKTINIIKKSADRIQSYQHHNNDNENLNQKIQKDLLSQQSIVYQGNYRSNSNMNLSKISQNSVVNNSLSNNSQVIFNQNDFVGRNSSLNNVRSTTPGGAPSSPTTNYFNKSKYNSSKQIINKLKDDLSSKRIQKPKSFTSRNLLSMFEKYPQNDFFIQNQERSNQFQ